MPAPRPPGTAPRAPAMVRVRVRVGPAGTARSCGEPFAPSVSVTVPWSVRTVSLLMSGRSGLSARSDTESEAGRSTGPAKSIRSH